MQTKSNEQKMNVFFSRNEMKNKMFILQYEKKNDKHESTGASEKEIEGANKCIAVMCIRREQKLIWEQFSV